MRDDYSRQQRTEILQAEYKDTSALRLTVWPQGESGPLLRSLAGLVRTDPGQGTCFTVYLPAVYLPD